MPYGISSSMWAQMSPEDQNAVMQDYHTAQGNMQAAAQVPTIGGYVQPTTQQVQQALAQSGLDSQTQQAVLASYTQTTQAGQQSTSTSSSGGAQNPSWVYAVNMPSTYPDFAAMKAAGAGLVIADDDPNFQLLMDGAKQWGVQVAVNVSVRSGETPEQYAAKVAAFNALGVNKLVLDIEAYAKNSSQGGYAWSTQAAALLKQAVGNTSVAVTMEPHQSGSDFNYSALQSIGGSSTQFWIQSYDGNMNEVSESWAVGGAKAAGVTNIVAIHGPNTAGQSGYVSYGIPQTGASAAGVYSTKTTAPPGSTPGPQNPANTTPPPSTPPQNTPNPPNTIPSPGPGSPPVVAPDVPTTGPTGPGAPPPNTTPPPPDTTTTTGTDWASAYFQSFGLPPDIAAQVNKIFNTYPDVNQATQFALAYIRGTQWYADTFPGIQYGMQHGIISSEQDYRSYVTQLDTLSMQYTGQHVTGAQVAQYLGYGWSPDLVGKHWAGRQAATTSGEDWNYYLGNFSDQGVQSNQNLWTLGEEQQGIDSPLGQRLQNALQQATARYQKVFEGVLATPSLSLGSQGGLTAPSMQLGRAKPDIAA